MCVSVCACVNESERAKGKKREVNRLNSGIICTGWADLC